MAAGGGGGRGGRGGGAAEFAGRLVLVGKGFSRLYRTEVLASAPRSGAERRGDTQLKLPGREHSVAQLSIGFFMGGLVAIGSASGEVTSRGRRRSRRGGSGGGGQGASADEGARGGHVSRLGARLESSAELSASEHAVAAATAKLSHVQDQLARAHAHGSDLVRELTLERERSAELTRQLQRAEPEAAVEACSS
jgi:hypothetical protein